MPRAIPPVTNGADVDSSRSRPELGAVVADGAPPPPRSLVCICLGRLRQRRGWSCTLAFSTHHIVWADRSLRTQVHVSRTCPGPIGLGNKRFGKPTAIVLIFEHPRRILAPRNSERRSAGKSDAQIDATARQSQPRLIVCLSLKTHFASSRWRTASLGLPTS